MFEYTNRQAYEGIRQGPEPGIGTGGYELGTGAVE